MKLKVVLAVVAAIGLSGCSLSPNKKTMGKENYRMFAEHAVTIDMCFEQKSLTVDEFAQGRSDLEFTLNTWIYDKDELVATYKDIRNSYPRMPEFSCYQMKGRIAAIKKSVEHEKERQQAAADREYQQWLDAAASLNQNKTTWCNKVGNTVMCR